MPGISDETMQLVRTLFSDEGEEMPIGHRVDLLASIRAMSPEAGLRADKLLFENIARLRKGLKEVMASQDELKGILDKLTAPPWFPAVFVAPMNTPDGPRAIVRRGNSRTVVELEEDVDLDALGAGDEVFLSREQNVILGVSPLGPATVGETARFERRTEGGQLILSPSSWAAMWKRAVTLRA